MWDVRSKGIGLVKLSLKPTDIWIYPLAMLESQFNLQLEIARGLDQKNIHNCKTC